MHPMRDEATLPIQLAGLKCSQCAQLLALTCIILQDAPVFSSRAQTKVGMHREALVLRGVLVANLAQGHSCLDSGLEPLARQCVFRLWRARLGSLCLPCELYAQAQARVTMSDGWSGTEAAALPFGVWELSDMESMLQLRSDHALAIFVPAEHDNM